MAKKRKHNEAEIANDPSLRWNPYKKWELLVSDAHGGERFRFNGYADDGRVMLATVSGITPLPEPVDPLTVRRPSFKPEPMTDEAKHAIVARATAARAERVRKRENRS